VGVRKSIGALPSALIFQFVLEALLLSFIALLMALVFVQLLLPIFNEVTDKHMRIEFTSWIFLTGICCITLMCGLLAGSYPALFLSSIRPASVLKGSFQAQASGGRLRSSLVVAQFVASVILIVLSVVVYDQIAFIRQKDLGFEKNNVITIDLHNDLAKNSSAFKSELLGHPSVTSVAFGGSNVFQMPITTHEPKWPTKQEGQSVSFKVYRCDEDFISLMQIKLLGGRNFSDVNNQDASNYIVNRMAVEAMGLTIENAVGSEFEMWNGKGTIIGVTENFNTGNLHEAIQPLIFMYSQHSGQYYFIRTNGSKEALTHIERVVRKFDPDYPFQYSFLTDTYVREYRTEATIGGLALFFTTVAILISCLGLFGLALFTAERRVKELGVRKVLGASTTNLVAMLCTDFAKLVIFALMVGLPFAYSLSNVYLESYVFHTRLTVWNFALPAVGLIALALLTISYQSYRAAARNPAESLRSE
jgi:ABC-type antimicrobial peptide transport system permease subunit